MKGIIFTEFLELVEEKFGLTMVDKIIEQSDLESLTPWLDWAFNEVKTA